MDLVETYNIGWYTVSDILKRSDLYRQMYEDNISSEKTQM